MQRLKGVEKRELTTIEVVGKLEIVQTSPGLVRLGLCGPPAPRVLCTTYQANGRKAGDTVVVIGSIVPGGPDFIHLDPCLHSQPE